MKKILIAAHYNLNNGDRAVLEATIQQLIKKGETDIVVSAFAPQQLVDKRFKTVSWAINSDLKKKIFSLIVKLKLTFLLKYCYKLLVEKEYLNEVKNADIIFMSGGHHLTDILGRKTFFSLAIQFLVPIYMNKSVYLLPQSIGPINENNKDAFKTLKYILNNVSSIAYRDKSSKKFLDKNNITKNCEYVPDIVYSIKCNEKNIKNNKSVGIALYCNYVKEKKELFDNVIMNLKQTISYLLKNGYEVSIIPMEVKDTSADDRKVANNIINSIDEKLRKKVYILEPKDDNILSTVSLFANKDFILAYKTHSVVFSIVNHTPVIAIAYHPKSIEFMETIGLEKYAILDKNATLKNLTELINDITNNSKTIINKEISGLNNNINIIDDYLNRLLEIK